MLNDSLLDARDYHSTHVGTPFVGSPNPSGNQTMSFFQNMACHVSLESSCLGIFNFKFREKLYELCLEEGFESTYFA
jgi:hypothetical protein